MISAVVSGGVKWPEREFNLLPEHEVKNEWSYISTRLYALVSRKGTSLPLAFPGILNT